jgi:MerR family copper efflux transcriptional regulator
MATDLSIGTVSRLGRLTPKAIRFYEARGYIPPTRRSDSGYRHYSSQDVRRLRLIRQMRVLGLPLPDVKLLVERAFAADCATFAEELATTLKLRRNEISERIAELEDLRTSLDDLAKHVEHCECKPGERVADCDYCVILDDEGR